MAADRRRFQFSLRSFLVATSTVGAAGALAISLYYHRVVEPRPRLFQAAVSRGDVAEVDRLLKIDPGLVHGHRHRRHNQLDTPLQIAIRGAYWPGLLSRLLQAHPDLNERSNTGLTALHIAAERSREDAVAELLKRGADPNPVDRFGRTPLDFANAFDQHGRITELLLAHGADPSLAKGTALELDPNHAD